jgi:beta-glucosidase
MLLSACVLCANTASVRPWQNLSLSPADRAEQLVAAMSFKEKVHYLHASCHGYTGNVCANERLGVPPIRMNDGPQGFRDNAHPGTSTAWPCALAIAATFDEAAAGAWGAAMGEEFYGKGANVQLGPGLCLARVPWNGRNFEYLSGEDPHLGARMVGPVVRGIQAQGVAAVAKHWIDNSQETDRTSVSSDVDERTQFEMYYPPFEAAVRAGVSSVMCSYNRVEGRHSCENAETLRHLKQELDFDGWVMSDWGATHSMALAAGLDQEMPTSLFMNELTIASAIATDELPALRVDDAVRRVLTPLIRLGFLDANNTHTIASNVSTAAHVQLSRRLAAQSLVLLKNDCGALPLRRPSAGDDASPLPAAGLPHAGGRGAVVSRRAAEASSGFVLALIGATAMRPVVGGGGSGAVRPGKVPSPYDAIRAKLGIGPAARDCAGGNGEQARRVCVYYHSGSNVTGAAELAASADVAIVFVSTTSTEGKDRVRHRGTRAEPNLSFDSTADALVEAVAAARRPRRESAVGGCGGGGVTIVCCVSPGAVLTPWRHSVDAITLSFLPGQEYAPALADILFGDASPSASLPLTLPNATDDLSFSREQWPGVGFPGHRTSFYSERLKVGYRGYDAAGLIPAFPFGHGLTYTRFRLSGLQIAPVAGGGSTRLPSAVRASRRRLERVDPLRLNISLTIGNAGEVHGTATPQLYLGFPSAAGEPPRQLRGFVKVPLAPGESQRVGFGLSERDVSAWDTHAHAWVPVPGNFSITVGLSLRDAGAVLGWVVL